MPFVLTIDDGAGAQRQLRLDQGRVCIGRGAANDVVLPGAGVSRLHARIEQRRDGFVLHDESSANGTDLNGARISGPQALRRGDRIGIGPVVLTFTEQGSGGVAFPAAREMRSSAAPAEARPAPSCSGRRRRSGPGWGLPRPLRIGAPWAAGLLACGVCALALRNPRGQAPRSEGPGERQAMPPGGPLPWNGGRAPIASSQDRRGRERSLGEARILRLAASSGGLDAARAAYERGRRKLEERRIAPRNLHDAWKAFAEARRHLQGIDPEPRLEGEIAQLIRDLERDLERECGKLVFTALRFERYGEEEKAQNAWREVLLHFPGEDPTGCRKKAQGNILSAQASEAE